MNVKVILNPYANRWRAQAQIGPVEAALRAARLDYDLTVTRAPHEGTAVAAAAARQGYDAIVAAGGDGTIGEVVNGLLQAAGDGPSLPFGIIPLGTANDFCRMAGLPLDLPGSVRVIAAGQTRQVDAGMVNGRYFINNSAAAMEPMVTLENIRMQRLSGELRYLVALARAIIKLKAWQMEVVWEGGSYTGPAYLLSVCNSPRTGGFTMAPGALLDDGLFDMVFAPQLPKRTVLAVLLRLLRGGRHIHHKDVVFERTPWLRVASTPGTPVHADGEIFTESATVVAYQILPRKVTLLVG